MLSEVVKIVGDNFSLLFPVISIYSTTSTDWKQSWTPLF